MVMLTMGHSLAADIRLPDNLPIPGTPQVLRRNRVVSNASRVLRAVVYTAAAMVAIGGLPMICAMLYDAQAVALLFNH